MRIELVFFSPSVLVLDATKLLFHKMKNLICVRGSLAFDFVHADMSTFIEWYDVDAMLSVINGPPFFDSGQGALLARHFPFVMERSATICQHLKLKTWDAHPYLPDGFTISVPTGMSRCPILLLYGRGSTRDDRFVSDGMSSALRLVTRDCRIGVPCEGSIFGTVPPQESASQIVGALEAHTFKCESM